MNCLVFNYSLVKLQWRFTEKSEDREHSCSGSQGIRIDCE